MTNEATKYGFIPRGTEDEAALVSTEKTVSCKVDPATWKRWKGVQQRLASHGEVTLAGVVRPLFLEALDGLEAMAAQLENSGKATSASRRGAAS